VANLAVFWEFAVFFLPDCGFLYLKISSVRVFYTQPIDPEGLGHLVTCLKDWKSQLRLFEL